MERDPIPNQIGGTAFVDGIPQQNIRLEEQKMKTEARRIARAERLQKKTEEIKAMRSQRLMERAKCKEVTGHEELPDLNASVEAKSLYKT